MNKKIVSDKGWLLGAGYCLAGGYVMNSFIIPAICMFSDMQVQLIEWKHLHISLVILLVVSSVRNITVGKIKLFGGKVVIDTVEDHICKDKKCKLLFKRITERYWIALVGWALVLGYFVNCFVVPFANGIPEVDWYHLNIGFLILMVVGVDAGHDVEVEDLYLGRVKSSKKKS